MNCCVFQGVNSRDRSVFALGLSAAINFNRLGTFQALFAKHYFWQASVTKPNALCILFPPYFIVLAHVVFVGNLGKFITKVLSY